LASESSSHDISYDGLESWHVVLDTSAVFKDYTLTRPEITHLLTRTLRPTYQICLPAIVVQEIVNHYREDLEAANRRLGTALDSIAKLVQRPIGAALTVAQVEFEVHAFQVRFIQLLGQHGVRIEAVPAALAGVEMLVARDLGRRKPFSDQRSTGREEGGMRDRSGMRDAIIWESVLALCQREPRSSIFVSKNTRDFADSSTTELHQDLRSDLEDLGIDGLKVQFYASIESFMDAHLTSTASENYAAEPEAFSTSVSDNDERLGE